MIGRVVGACCLQEELARGDWSALCEGRLGLGRERVPHCRPGCVEGAVVTVADTFCHCQDLANIETAVADVGQRPGAEFVVQVVGEEQSHRFLRR